MELRYSIQSSDLSSKDYDGIDFEGAKKLILDVDWGSENQKATDLEDAGEDSCPYNIMFYNQNAYFQVMNLSGNYEVYCSIPKSGFLGKLLGVTTTKTLVDISETKLFLYLDLFFQSKFDEIN